MRFGRAAMAVAATLALGAGEVSAAELSIVSGSVGADIQELRTQLAEFEAETGHQVDIVEMPASTSDQFGQYRLWLAAGTDDIDIYRVDVIWAPQLANQFVDLRDAMADVIGDHFPSVIESQTVEGRLVAFPMYTDAPALFYRKDLLEKYGRKPPTTWEELTETAKEIQDQERAAGNRQIYGFVFQGAPYEGLTCNGLEWAASSGGGQIVSPEGEITINNEAAARALERAHGWVREIAPAGVLAYKEEEARGVWQTGNAVFMRNWPYAYALSNGEDSPVKGKFEVTTLPAEPGSRSAPCLGGWNLAVSKYSRHKKEAIELVRFLSSRRAQKERALTYARLPTIPALYDDPDIAESQPIIAEWADVVEKAVPRPSAPTKRQYNEVSKEFWTAVNETLAGAASAETNLQTLEHRLRRLKRDGWR
ncbi:ABC transporter substrate-binding protein [Afifella sp. YEN Y35]|uniref:ABC transporter substrate-binding protein n=1 Tax=Afifella sp. YEN Y35 TaxID=3388337 RepID=UPI0039DF74BD